MKKLMLLVVVTVWASAVSFAQDAKVIHQHKKHKSEVRKPGEHAPKAAVAKSKK